MMATVLSTTRKMMKIVPPTWYGWNSRRYLASFAFLSLKKKVKSLMKKPTMSRETVSLNPYMTQI